MGDDRNDVTEAESQVLKVLWEHGPGRVRDVAERLGETGVEWKRSTVITLLQRLERKGFVHSNRSGFAYLFSPAVSRQQYLNQRLDDLADEFCGGEPVPLLLAFAQQHQFTGEELRQFREMIEQSQKRRATGDSIGTDAASAGKQKTAQPRRNARGAAKSKPTKEERRKR